MGISGALKWWDASDATLVTVLQPLTKADVWCWLPAGPECGQKQNLASVKLVETVNRAF
jgi:hypothetical protein